MSGRTPLIRDVSYSLFHAPYFTRTYGSTVEAEREKNPESEYLKTLPKSLRHFTSAVSYVPNQVFIGSLDPKNMPEKPWHNRDEEHQAFGAFGAVLDETALYGLIKFSDVFNLVLISEEAAEAVKESFAGIPALKDIDAGFLKNPSEPGTIEEELKKGALPLYSGEKLFGCVKPGHPTDPNMTAHVLLENLTAKATAVFAVRDLFARSGASPAGVDYIIETSEEACGDVNQRGGGNFAKAIGELCGCVNATGSDTRSFCAAPVHGLVQAASLVQAGTFNSVLVTGGGALAKLGMNSKKHIEKGLPVLEDCLGSFAVLVKGEEKDGEGLVLRTDIVGIHTIGSGSSPQAIVGALVSKPLASAGLKFSDLDYYAPEMHNPEITETAGAGNVTLSNLKMIAALAVMEKQISREEIDSFIAEKGSSGWAPTQGHIPSGVPALGWILKWGREGRVKRALVIGKGSLFLGRMTNLFDGISIMTEYRGGPGKGGAPKVNTGLEVQTPSVYREEIKTQGTVRLGLTLPGSELGKEELILGAQRAMAKDPSLKVLFFGKDSGSEEEARIEMEGSLAKGEIDGVLTFHYPFPVGTATVGVMEYPGRGGRFLLATTTGVSSSERSSALLLNAVKGIAAAKALGINNPSVGFLNLEGAQKARKSLADMIKKGYSCRLAASVRGEELLRGNDLLAGDADVIVCDTLTGNVIIKLLGAYSSGGRFEVSGSGYGVGIGDIKNTVGIISRASSAAVTARALSETALFIRGRVNEVYLREYAEAVKYGLKDFIGEQEEKMVRKKPDKKPVTRQIEGIEILSLEDAEAMVLSEGIYCEAGMGCTGPVLMTAPEDEARAKEILKKEGII